jgi:hypothetical protein
VDDWDLWLRIASRCGIHFLNRVLACYRTHGENYSGAASAQFAAYQERRVQVLDKFFAGPMLPSRAAAMKPLAYRNLYTVIGLQWAGAGRWKPALTCFIKAFRAHPSPAVLGRIAFNLLLHLLRRWKPSAPFAGAYLGWRDKRQAAGYHEKIGGQVDG